MFYLIEHLKDGVWSHAFVGEDSDLDGPTLLIQSLFGNMDDFRIKRIELAEFEELQNLCHNELCENCGTMLAIMGTELATFYKCLTCGASFELEGSMLTGYFDDVEIKDDNLEVQDVLVADDEDDDFDDGDVAEEEGEAEDSWPEDDWEDDDDEQDIGGEC